MLKLMLATVLTALLLISGLAQVPTVVLMQSIREHANFIGKYGSYEQLRSGQVDFGSHSDVVSEHARKCVEAIDQALAAGVSDSKTIEVKFMDRNDSREESKTLSLAELRSLCEKLSSSAGKEDSLRKATQAAIQASGWPGRIAEGEDFSGPNARVAADAAKECIKAIDEALASKNPGSTVIELIGDNKMTLTEAREMCVYVRDKATKQVSSDVAAEEALYEPFRKLLSSDRLYVYNEWKNRKIYTTGGRLLRTPESYRDATVWCSVGVNRDGIIPVWDMDCWRFRGMTQVGDLIKKNGTGDEPPSSAFP